MSPLVNPAALFRIRLVAPRRERLWPPSSWDLDDTCRIPSFADVAGVPDVVDLWTAWNPEGLALRSVARQVPGARWCHPTRPEDSDGLHLWIATRPTGDSHRAGRYCHRLALLPTGGGRLADKPVAVAATIPRTSETPSELPAGAISIDATSTPDGWMINAFIRAAALHGWDPVEMPRLGFFVAMVDRRLGKVPCFAPPEYPWDSDPTTWAELELRSA